MKLIENTAACVSDCHGLLREAQSTVGVEVENEPQLQPKPIGRNPSAIAAKRP